MDIKEHAESEEGLNSNQENEKIPLHSAEYINGEISRI